MLDDTRGVFFSIPTLDRKAKSRLSKILSIDIDGPELPIVIEALEEATIIQKSMGGVGQGMTQTEFRGALISCKGHLDATIKRLEEMPSSFLQLLEQACWHTNGCDSSFIAEPKDRSTLIDKLKAVVAGIEFQLQHMSEPTKQKHQYTAAIAQIRGHYAKTFDSKPVSAHRNSVFSKLITFWMTDYLGLQQTLPQRHIEKALR